MNRETNQLSNVVLDLNKCYIYQELNICVRIADFCLSFPIGVRF